LRCCKGNLEDNHGGWIIGFSHLLGKCSILEAELWGTLDSLALVQEKKGNKVNAYQMDPSSPKECRRLDRSPWKWHSVLPFNCVSYGLELGEKLGNLSGEGFRSYNTDILLPLTPIVEFIETDGSGLSLTTNAVNMGTEANTESPTTRLCGGFIGLLQSGYYNVPEISLGRHSSVSGTDLNFGGQYLSRSSYTEGSSMYTEHQTNSFFGRHMGYRRIDDLLLLTETGKGTSNPLLEDDNKGIDEEEDAVEEKDTGEEEGAVNAIDEDELDPKPICKTVDNGRMEDFCVQQNVQLDVHLEVQPERAMVVAMTHLDKTVMQAVFGSLLAGNHNVPQIPGMSALPWALSSVAVHASTQMTLLLPGPMTMPSCDCVPSYVVAVAVIVASCTEFVFSSLPAIADMACR
ncbi:hypothetical protein Goshw_011090, partial [Gossypium schwendimanii]|nr:hypothetical protein [Gossypium schwendimanii]